jgi:hypothetical protein
MEGLLNKWGFIGMHTLNLIVEKSQGRFWGRVRYEDAVITDIDKTIEGLERRIKSQLIRYFNLKSDAVTFTRHYDLTALFVRFHCLKITAIAERSRIHPELLREYVSGMSYPTAEEARRVETAIRELGEELVKASVISLAAHP